MKPLLALFSILPLLAACAGTTAIPDNHPAFDSSPNATKVYFIRPDPGFRGVMDKPVAISLNGVPLFEMAKGQYTLLALKPGKAAFKTDSLTVVGTTNTLTPVSAGIDLDLQPGTTIYLYIGLIPRGLLAGSVFVPYLVARERALQLIPGVAPVGMAVREPIR